MWSHLLSAVKFPQIEKFKGESIFTLIYLIGQYSPPFVNIVCRQLGKIFYSYIVQSKKEYVNAI